MITSVALSPAVDKIYYVDNFEAGNLYRVKKVVKSAGGKGVNVARVAAILGEKVSSIGFKGGEAGRWIEQELKKNGVNTDFIEVEGESRTNINIIDGVNNTETEVLEMGPLITKDNLDKFIDVYKEILIRTSVIVCSGGVPQGVPADFYTHLIDISREYGVKAILDTSGEMLKEGIKAKPYMIKPNLRELSNFVGRQLNDIDEIISACREIIAMGVEYVVTSMGKQGALMVSKHLALFAKAPQVSVVNTIGSGDSMVAGMAAGISRGQSKKEILALGVSCGAVNAQYHSIGFVDNKLVEEYFSKIEVKEIF